ncbi:hypothetical protein [Microvirga lenta]|uniref:hypothetical protein n=1 Tax=Microvirga lenta TaxID=2881337 RepID=UPI001CFEB636|nr:hypothetical protein [Microvirga lenta]MCB5174218.1 hypothetical protein [Microvirga lenta]
MSTVSVLKPFSSPFGGFALVGRVVKLLREILAETHALREDQRRQHPSLEW